MKRRIGVSVQPVLCVVVALLCGGVQNLIVTDSSLSLCPVYHHVADRARVFASATPTHSARTETSRAHPFDEIKQNERKFAR